MSLFHCITLVSGFGIRQNRIRVRKQYSESHSGIISLVLERTWGSEMVEAEKAIGLPPHPPLTIGIAIDGKGNSKYLVNWALDMFILEENVAFKLLHVRPMILFPHRWGIPFLSHKCEMI